ncbi:MAG: type II toxin-antitoxin system PemK/MazF family toxin [Candidatus Protochlamydia sp.]|nr:type II toxin-antitoxin system PemK/MazF family toxin [Candidatus Protochlamydia sp.]
MKNKEGKVLLNQIRTIDKQRLDGKIASLEKETMQQVDKALKIALALN